MNEHRPLRRIALAFLATWTLCTWTRVHAPAPGEPLPLRWARTAASHPVRTWVALTLIGSALGRRRQDRPPAKQA